MECHPEYPNLEMGGAQTTRRSTTEQNISVLANIVDVHVHAGPLDHHVPFAEPEVRPDGRRETALAPSARVRGFVLVLVYYLGRWREGTISNP